MFAGQVPDVMVSKGTDSFSRIYTVEWTEEAKFGIPFHLVFNKDSLVR